MKNILVSLIIPIYNAEKHLAKNIDSILNQTHQNIEIILVNDGSSDESDLICEKYKNKDIRIKTIHQNNRGVSTARNIGVLKSKGSFLQFVDADDYIESTMVEELLSVYKIETDLVICGYYKNTTKSKKIIPKNEGVYEFTDFMSFFTELFKKTLINSPGNKLYDANIIKKNEIKFPIDVSNGEDLMFNIEYLQHCKKVSLIKRPLYHYNTLVNSLSLTKKYKENYFENRKKVFDSLSGFVENYTKESSSVRNLLEQTYSNYIIESLINLFHEENKLTLKKKKESILEIIEDKFVKDNIHKIDRNKYRGVLTRFLLKHKLVLGISIYFNIGLKIKKHT